MRMTPTELKKRHLAAYPESHFFDRKTMQYWGQKMSNMKVEKDTETIEDYMGNMRECYVLVADGRDMYDFYVVRKYYFDTETFNYIRCFVVY